MAHGVRRRQNSCDLWRSGSKVNSLAKKDMAARLSAQFGVVDSEDWYAIVSSVDLSTLTDDWD